MQTDVRYRLHMYFLCMVDAVDGCWMDGQSKVDAACWVVDWCSTARDVRTVCGTVPG